MQKDFSYLASQNIIDFIINISNCVISCDFENLM